MVVSPPIFREWLGENAELRVLPVWRSRPVATAGETLVRPIVDESTPFPISEDDLLPVAQRLVYLNQPKEVAEVRLWLRQFSETKSGSAVARELSDARREDGSGCRYGRLDA